MFFAAGDVLEGGTILEINMASNAPGDVSLHNTIIRVGGTTDTIANKNCGNADIADCKAAFAFTSLP